MPNPQSMLRTKNFIATIALMLGMQAGAPAARASGDDIAAQRRQFATAVAAFERGDDEAALRGFTEARRSYAALDDYHLHFIARIHLKRGDTEAARRTLAQLLVEYPTSVHAGTAALEVGRFALAERDFVAARRHLERAVFRGDDAVTAAARLELAKVTFHTADARAAHEAFAEVRRQSRGTELGRVAKEFLTTLRTQNPDLVPTGRGLLDEIDVLLAERDQKAALHFAERLATTNPELRPQALRRRADALFALGETEPGFATLWEIVDQYGRTQDAPQVLYRIATLLWNRDRDAAAKRAFERYLTEYPRHGKGVDARYALARIEAAAGRTEEAQRAYHNLIRSFPNHALANEARWRLGWLEYRRGDWWEAAKAFADLAERSKGNEHEAAMYWRARCHHRLGRDDRAGELYRSIAGRRSYYGLWARARLDQLKSGSLPALSVRRAAPSTAPAPIPVSPPPAGIESFHWSRFIELDAAGLPEWAAAELAAVEAAAPNNAEVRRFLLRAYHRADRHDHALRLLHALGSAAGLSPSERRRALYPLAYWDQVRHEAQQRHVDPLLVLALMRQESAFQPAVRSPANAYGLMQILPTTATRIAADPAVAGADPNRLTDPRHNIRLGVFYLGGLLDLFGGNPYKALAAYNGGEAAVAKWDERWPGAEPDEWVDAISFRETRDYVKKVVGNYLEYRHLYD